KPASSLPLLAILLLSVATPLFAKTSASAFTASLMKSHSNLPDLLRLQFGLRECSWCRYHHRVVITSRRNAAFSISGFVQEWSRKACAIGMHSEKRLEHLRWWDSASTGCSMRMILPRIRIFRCKLKCIRRERQPHLKSIRSPTARELLRVAMKRIPNSTKLLNSFERLAQFARGDERLVF